LPDVRLRPMTDDEFSDYRERSVAAYADDIGRAGRWPADEAMAQAEKQFAELLPDGARTEGMLVLAADDDTGTRVGSLWLGLTHPRGMTGSGYLWDIEVRAERRGLGYGRSLLVAGEDLLRSHGLSAVALNVFGDNETARRLYATNGYQTVSQHLRKAL
jgi:ribosomal protein S18 acetylase RimI-like enzyme